MQNLNGFLLHDAFRIYPLRIDRKPFVVYVTNETRRVIPLNRVINRLGVRTLAVMAFMSIMVVFIFI